MHPARPTSVGSIRDLKKSTSPRQISLGLVSCFLLLLHKLWGVSKSLLDLSNSKKKYYCSDERRKGRSERRKVGRGKERKQTLKEERLEP